jgi:hypothetical protein
MSVLYVALPKSNRLALVTPTRRLHMYALSHILSTLCTKSSELNLVRTWLIDFDNINATTIVSRQIPGKAG